MIRGLLTRVLPLVLLIGCWEAVTQVKDDPYFTPPSTIVSHMRTLWFSGPAGHLFLTSTATDNILPSLERLAIGLAASVLAGAVLGLLLGRSRRIYAYLDPALQFCRAIPQPTLAPVFIVIFSIGTQMQLASIIFSGIWPVLLNTADGVRSIDPLLLDTAEVYGLSRTDRLLRVIIPAAMPKIFAGLRIALSLSLILMVFSELLPGTSNGIGFELNDAYSRSDIPTMWAAIVLLAVLGLLFNTILLQAERRVLSWHRSARKATA